MKRHFKKKKKVMKRYIKNSKIPQAKSQVFFKMNPTNQWGTFVSQSRLPRLSKMKIRHLHTMVYHVGMLFAGSETKLRSTRVRGRPVVYTFSKDKNHGRVYELKGKRLHPYRISRQLHLRPTCDRRIFIRSTGHQVSFIIDSNEAVFVNNMKNVDYDEFRLPIYELCAHEDKTMRKQGYVSMNVLHMAYASAMRIAHINSDKTETVDLPQYGCLGCYDLGTKLRQQQKSLNDLKTVV